MNSTRAFQFAQQTTFIEPLWQKQPNFYSFREAVFSNNETRINIDQNNCQVHLCQVCFLDKGGMKTGFFTGHAASLFFLIRVILSYPWLNKLTTGGMDFTHVEVRHCPPDEIQDCAAPPNLPSSRWCDETNERIL